MRKVGVSGGAGFIGHYVCEELLSKGYTPVILDHHVKDSSEYAEDCEVFMGDVRDEVAMMEFAAHVDGIIHLAAVLGTQETITNPRPAALSNLMGGLNFLEAVAQYKLPGTYIAVGNWWMNNPYSITKNMVERFVHMYNADRGTKVNIVRAVNAYGPRQLAAAPFAHGKVRKITPALVCRALSSMSMELYGGGKQVSDMVYVADVAKALVLALEKADKGEVFPEAVEVGSANPVTVHDVATLINSLIASLGYKPVEIISLPMRPGEKEGDKVFAHTETLKYIDLKPSDLMSLEVGMGKTIQYFIDTEGKSWTKPQSSSQV